MVSRRRAQGQVILCLGCCCGRTDRGFPAVPVDRIKSAWKAGRLNRTIQLTISGCVGPCDAANVAMIVTPEGARWIGGLDGDADYDALLRWAESCQAAGKALPIPVELGRRRLDYLASPSRDGGEQCCASGSVGPARDLVGTEGPT